MTGRCYNCRGDDVESLVECADFDTGSRSFTLGRCRRCALVNTLGAAPEDISRAYSSAYYGSGQAKFHPVIERAIAWSNRRFAAGLLRTWARFDRTRATSVLDIGCGRADLLKAFGGLGATVRGIERTEFPLEETLAGVVHVGSVFDDVFRGARFDVIVLRHVLEHMEEPSALLTELGEHMNSGGLLAVAVPNFGSLQRELFGRHWFHLDLPRHLVHFEVGWLSSELESAGFEVIRIDSLDLLQNLYGFIQSALNLVFGGAPNRLYHLLKHGSRGGRLALIGWAVAVALVLPLAALESAVGLIGARGAAVTVYARWKDHHD